MKFAFIEGMRRTHRLGPLCRVLTVSASGYYRWRHRSHRRSEYQAQTLSEVREVFEASQRTYGSPRIHRELKARGRSHSRRFIGTLMRRNGMRARAATRRKPRSSPAVRSEAIRNVLQRRFHAAALNQVWAADLTYIPTAQGWLCLAVVVDLASRRVVGWATGRSADTALTLRALEMAVVQRSPGPGLLHHSDRGVQYSCSRYLDQLTHNRIDPSFSRVGNCWDNAVVESFFHTLKVERLRGRPMYATRTEAVRDLGRYIEGWYNTQRRHSTIGYMSPAEFERHL